MDEFLRDIHISLLREWIYNQKFDLCTITKDDEENIVIETKYGLGHINFYDDGIIELNVENRTTQEMAFFIHFQLKSLHHAIGLLKEMKECLETLVTHKKTKVLLSCSSGFTTGFFVTKLQEAAELLDKDLEFGAVAYSELFDVASDYDMILLAPQVSYMLSKVQAVLKDKIVLTLSTSLFGKYDVAGTFKFIEDELNKEDPFKEDELDPLFMHYDLSHHQKILCLAFIFTDYKVRLVSRLYGVNHEILEDYETYKSNIALSDITDMIDYILYKHPDIEVVSISMPGVIFNGKVTLDKYGYDHYDFKALLKKKYRQDIVLNNDVNAVVMGYFASQNEYRSISLLLQTKIGGKGGVGHIHNGHLITGRHNLAGEIKYLPIAFSNEYEKIKKTPEGAIEWTAKYCVAITSMVAPDAIVFLNRLVSNGELVRDEMKKYLPEDFIPDIIQIESLKEYMLMGSIILGLKEVNKEKKVIKN